ncbi:aldehyde dehydrogenase family protein [Thalassospira sp. B30-1]|uniref:aldehyde dehydrogenase family protein n=1 Tax=Thalassospira sp. B30-1 TaxID=2785911 RepID=UPI0020919354|nr:aldehyde dehydrogenase family protein [Thalassospira sp. B30-1]
MSYNLTGKHLIAGQWVAGEQTFQSEPAHGPANTFPVGTPALVDQAARAAEEAFWSYGYSTREERAKFLNRIADEIDARGAEITEIGTQETGLPEARLNGERGRTLASFACLPAISLPVIILIAVMTKRFRIAPPCRARICV